MLPRTPVSCKMVSRTCISIIAVILVPANGALADWFHDFNDGSVPASLVLFNPPGLPPSPTVVLDASSGYLTIADPLPASEGGAIAVGAREESEIFRDVRVSGSVNLDPAHRFGMGVVARNSPDGAYIFIVNFIPGSADEGRAVLLRADGRPSTTPEELAKSETQVDIDSSYVLQLDVVADQLTANVLDATGSVELISLSYFDPMPLAPGYSGVALARESGFEHLPLGGTWDDLSAVTIPEPAGARLFTVALAVRFAWRWLWRVADQRYVRQRLVYAGAGALDGGAAGCRRGAWPLGSSRRQAITCVPGAYRRCVK